MVDRSELYPGAVVTVKGRLSDAPKCLEDGSAVVAFTSRNGREVAVVRHEDILSVEPRPLAVGEPVRHRVRGIDGYLRGICGVLGWAQWDSEPPDFSTELLSDLTRIPEPAPAEERLFKPGDEVEAALDISGTLQVGVILAIAGDDAWVDWGDHFGRRTEPLDTLTPRTTMERAP